MNVVQARRPEVGAGGIARDNVAFQFYARINAMLSPEDCVLDLGAGRGAFFDRAAAWKSMVEVRGKVRRLAGCDIDPVVLTNPHLDDASVFKAGERLPYDDGTFDLIYCDWVLEHVEDVELFVAEVNRVLKPGGWFCGRTPNKWGYVAMAARLVPPASEQSVLRFVQPERREHDVFPKRYRLNTLGAVKRAFPDSHWQNCSYSANSTPSYHGGKLLLFDLIDWFQKLTPSAMNTVLLVFVQKRGAPDDDQPAESSPTQLSAKA